MFTKSDHTPQSARKESVEAVHRAMARFPLIVEILGQLGKAELPFPGDADVRHGCERALTAIMVELARIQPAPAGKLSKADSAPLEWLHRDEALQWVDADRLQRMQQFIERALGSANPRHH